MESNFRVGEWFIEPQLNSITRDDKTTRVEPKVMQVLVCLSERAGELVTKEQLMRAVWADTFVTDDVLTRSISELRKVFDDDAKEPRFIQTIPRSGYRLIAPVSYARRDEDSQKTAMTDSRAVETGVVCAEQVEGIRVVIEEREEDARRERLEFLLPSGAPSSVLRRFPLSRIGIAASVLLAAATAAVFLFSVFSRSRHVETSVAVKTIAVLPFRLLAAGSDDEYLGFGMADALITRLGSINQIIVRPTIAVRRYNGANADLAEVGRELQVDSVLDGSIQRVGNRLRITVQLVSVKEARHLWTEKFDERFTDIFAVEDSISEQVARALTLKLTGDERRLLTKHYTENSDAYQAYLKGRYHWNKRTEEGFKKALDYLQQAIDKDPNFGEAYAGMADCYVLLAEYGMLPPGETAARGKEAVTKALALDDSMAEAHSALGLIKEVYEWDFQGAEKEFKRAIELNPNYAMARSWYSCYLTAMGRFEEALAQMKRAQELDPVTPIITSNVGWAFYLAHRSSEAQTEYRKSLELDPNFPGSHRGLGWCYELDRAYPEAIAEFQKVLQLSESPYNLASLGHAYGALGNRVEAEKVLVKLSQQSRQRYVPSYFTAVVYAGLGKKDQALDWLEKSYGEHFSLLAFLKVDPWFDDLHSDSRFQDLLRRIGLES